MKKLFLLCFIISSVIFTSCLKIEEYISINNEGIGSYKIKLDLANIAMFHQLMNSPTDRLAEEIQYYIDKIRAVKGISNVNFLHSEKYIEISFDFENTSAFRRVLLSLTDEHFNIFIPNYIKISNNKIVKKNISPYIDKIIQYINMQNSNDFLINDYILGFINFNTYILTPDSIKKISHPLAQQSKQNEVVLKTTLRDLKYGFNNKIKVKF
ncbi:MAG: hypothetical protein WBL11_04825 [Bacteroidales bacterium]|jgi:hypothetical protein|nr:hypothetical protein [Bacteroidales bacterium]MDI9575288.1 hypothetical protein [Bacteroidota bacterium]MDD3755374.1 hypothetical protein [Bacteroidales bacterium]MDY0400648.1 hypothetical protein [Bacteroidales bacterium]HHW58804.1 hypothetical protein [Bacteroidales bacterium]